jgi:Fic family protein
MQNELTSLLNKKQVLNQKLTELIYGSIEIREKEEHKYLYVHYRNNGKLATKYIDEYTSELHNLILNNNVKAKSIKTELRQIEKALKKLNYQENDLPINTKKCLDLAKRNLVDTIYKQAVLEGIATTFVQTESIVEGSLINNMSTSDVMKIINLKHAWEFILNENVIMSPSNFALLAQINKLVIEKFYYNAGLIRSVPVRIGGTDYIPPIPLESKITEELNDIINSTLSAIDKALEILLYVMKKQIFIDGNKRCAVILANHFLISKGLGIIAIPEKLINEYKILLIFYYEGKDENKIKEFLKNNCLTLI